MAKPFKDKLKNAGELISGAIADVGKQAKDSEMIDKISKGAKDGLVFVSNGVKDGAGKLSNGVKSGTDAIKNAVAEHKKQGIQDVIESKEQEDNKERKVSLDEQLHDAVNKYNVAYAEFENNGSAILRQRERSVDLLENVEKLINSIANHPKSFNADFEDIQLYKKEFKDVCDYATQELNAAKRNSEYEKYGRDKNTKRRYGRAWKRIRDKYAAEHPYCERCFARGVLVPVEEIHHKIPLAEGGTHDRSNLIALCKSCHSQIHAKSGDRWHDR